MIGSTLAGYRLIEQIGAGGMATVYKAYDPSTERHVAVKVLPPQYSEHPLFRERFRREAKAIAALQHPFILPLHAYGEDPASGTAYLVMPYMDSGTLAERLLHGPLSLGQTARLLEQLSGALDHAHRNGIIHRDVKPSNVLLDREGNAYLTDFGLARIVESISDLTGSGTALGTPAYMSPEQCRGLRDLTPATDIYSLGVMLYQMVTGQVPFQAETPIAVIHMHLSDPLPPPSSIAPELPPEVEQIITKALAKQPEQRFASAAALNEAFTRALATSSTTLDRPISPPTPTSEAPAPPLLPTLAGLLALAVLSGLATFLFLNDVLPAISQLVSRRAQPVVTATAPPTSEASPTPQASPTPTNQPSPTPALIPTQFVDAPHLPGGVLMQDQRGHLMALVPGGSFMMGSNSGQDDEQPVHRVTLTQGYWMDIYEVTNAQYQVCANEGECSPPTGYQSYAPQGENYYTSPRYSNYPVVNVTWQQAQTFCAWRGARLPSEAEWEYAARGPDGHTYPWGEASPSPALLNFNNGVGLPLEVGSYPDGISPFGLFDMAGNAAEWVADRYASYPDSQAVNPTGPDEGEQFVMRGGGALSPAQEVRSTARSKGRQPDNYLGFRCARTASGSE